LWKNDDPTKLKHQNNGRINLNKKLKKGKGRLIKSPEEGGGGNHENIKKKKCRKNMKVMKKSNGQENMGKKKTLLLLGSQLRWAREVPRGEEGNGT